MAQMAPSGCRLTIRPSRSSFAARLESAVRPDRAIPVVDFVQARSSDRQRPVRLAKMAIGRPHSTARVAHDYRYKG